MSRTRSEYRTTSLAPAGPLPDRLELLTMSEAHRDASAALLLDAYRNTIDDEGETIDDALAAIDYYLGAILRPHSFLVVEEGSLIAMAFVVVVRDLHYIDPVCTAAAAKGRGLGAMVVRQCLSSLAAAEVFEVGATITDGNTPSERLFAGLGFVRVGEC